MHSRIGDHLGVNIQVLTCPLNSWSERLVIWDSGYHNLNTMNGVWFFDAKAILADQEYR